MKVNFNQTFKTYEGEDLLVNGQPQSFNKIVAMALFNGDSIKSSGNVKEDGEKKLMAYTLSTQIYKSKEPVEITPEEAILIKEAVGSLTPGCYGQIVNLLDRS